MNADELSRLIEAGLPQAEVRVHSEDDTHFEAIVLCPSFAGKGALQRHQMVYRSLGARMGREIHALSLQAFTPEEWAARKQA